MFHTNITILRSLFHGLLTNWVELIKFAYLSESCCFSAASLSRTARKQQTH